MDVLKHRKAVKPLATMIAIAATAAPAVAHGKALPVEAAAEQGGKSKPAADRRAGDGLAKHERAYIEARRKVIKRYDVGTAGRNIVRDGYRTKDGDTREARKGEIVESTELMRSWLAPEPAEAAAPAETAAAPAEGTATETEAATAPSSAAAPTSVVECESGGDYGAVNPAGYYGAYQFDQSTWDAYAPEGYAGTNPAQAPPAVQDAAAANVDYDAWPNC